MKSPALFLPFLAAWLSCGLALRAGGVVQECQETALREALQGGGLVTFACAGTIVLTQPIDIAADTILDATGQQVTLSGGQSVQLFAVHPGSLLRLVNLTLVDGRAAAGGALSCEEATVILERCTLSGHQSVGAAGAEEQTGSMARGGALFAFRSNVHLLSCLLTNNQAVAGAGGPGARQGARGGVAQGGAVWISGGALKASDCRLISNDAIGGAGGTGVQGGHGGDALGGGIYCDSDDVELVQTEIAQSRARGGSGGVGTVQSGPNGGGSGGGLLGAGGWVRMTACTVASCQASGSPPNPASGGGLANLATLMALNTTVASNYTTMSPAGDSIGGGVYNRGFLTAEHCTVAANEATGGAQNKGGNLENAGGYVALRGTVIAYCKNQWEVFGGVIDQGGNLCGDATAHFTDPTSRNLVDPKLGPLANNGGPVRTMVPLPGSPVVDAVATSGFPTNDARGLVRPAAGWADAGAVEGAAVAPVITMAFEPAAVRTGAVAVLRVTVLNQNSFTLRGLALRPTLSGWFGVAEAPPAEVGCGGTAQAPPGAYAPTFSFPEIAAQASCSFALPIAAMMPSTSVVDLATTTSENLGSLAGPQASATILALANPAAHVLSAVVRPDGSVLLTGVAYALGFGGSAYFEYGPNTAYGMTTAVQTMDTGLGAVTVEAVLRGLPAATQFHYRLVYAWLEEETASADTHFATPTPGAGTALRFDGLNDWVAVRQGFPLTSNVFTMEFWAWPTASQVLPAENVNGLFSGQPMRFALYPSVGSRLDDVEHVSVGVSVGHNGVVVFEHGQGLLAPVLSHAAPLTNWTHIAVVYGQGPPKLLLDGQWVHTGLASSRVQHPSVEIGSTHRSPGAGLGFYEGWLDEVRVWSRALTSDDLALLKWISASGDEDGLLACLHLDEGTGSAVADASGHGFHGEVVDNPFWVPSLAPFGVPYVSSLEATEITTDGALLRALANGGSADSHIAFEWGAAGALDRRTPPQDLPSGPGPQTVAAALTGLRPAMDYLFRPVIEAGGQTRVGAPRSFITKAPSGAGLALRLAGGEAGVQAGPIFQAVTNDFTIEFWVRPTSGRPETLESGTGVREIAGQPFALFPQYGTGAYGESHAAAGVAVGTNGVSVFEHGFFHLPSVLVHETVIQGWVHVAVVYRQGRSSLLLNGRTAREGQPGGMTVHPSADLAKSATALGGGTGQPVGELDEVRIWNHARSEAEIQQDLYRRLRGDEAGLMLYYNFDAGPGTQVIDSSTFDRRGLVSGQPGWIDSRAPVDGPMIARTFLQDVGLDWASLAAEVNPHGHPAQAVLEWGPTPAFGNLSPAQPVAGNGDPVSLTATIAGLNPATDYFYRWVLEREGQYSLSDTRSFKTRLSSVGSALTFDGTDDFVTGQSVFTQVRDTFTMEIWVKPSAEITVWPERPDFDVWAPGFRPAISPENGSAAYGPGHATVGISVGINGVNVVEHGADYAPVVLSYPGLLREWTHLAVVYTQGQPSLFVNGVLARVGPTSNRIVHPGTSLGPAGFAGNTGFYAGLLDEVRIWNVARTVEEIRGNMRRSLRISEPNLVRYWPLDEAGEATVRNALASEDNGNIHGATWSASQIPIGRAFVEALRVVRSSPTGTELELVVQGNGGGGSVQVEWGTDANFGSISESVTIGPGEVDRRVVLPIGGPGIGPNLYYRSVVWNLARACYDLAGRMVVVSSTQGAALEFDGLESMVSMPTEPFGGVPANFTAEFWCLPTAARSDTEESGTANQILGTQRFALYPVFGPTCYGEGSAGAGISVGTNGVTVMEHGAGHWSSVLVLNQPLSGWNHVALVYSNGLPRLFLNGIHARDGQVSGFKVGPGIGLGGGAAVQYTFPFFRGLLDEVRIWKRALTSEEIRTGLHQALPPTQPDLVWNQHFDEGWGNLASDAVNPTRGGTLNPGVSWIASDAPLARITPCILLPDGSLRIQFSTAPSQTFVLSQSLNLVTWEPIRTNAASAGGVFEYTDSESANRPMRFYRLIRQP